MLKGSFLQSWKTTRKRRATTPACGPCSFRFNGPSQKTNHGSYQIQDGDPSGALSASGSAMPCAAHGPAVPDGSAFI
ncbi:hypothetical protein PSHT_07849 [Puccinia striiformis]|uniref:Uncharacterized protein n=1 Tax=Puccinia striiformis TaxID=27350 RepID=A0A2S4VUC3_9BASI|nr:hypothetical protein PSHT_07849 [Puccinia striiformis]